MTQTTRILAPEIKKPEQPNSGTAAEHSSAARKGTAGKHVQAHGTVRAVLHLPAGMPGVYRHAPSLKGA